MLELNYSLFVGICIGFILGALVSFVLTCLFTAAQDEREEEDYHQDSVYSYEPLDLGFDHDWPAEDGPMMVKNNPCKN
jgi:hypothetical protein